MQSSDGQSSGEMEILATIGTRGSPLALAQAHEVQDRLARAHDVAAERIAIKVGDVVNVSLLRDTKPVQARVTLTAVD